MSKPDPGADHIDERGAAAVLATVLAEPGGGRTVLGLLGAVPSLLHRPAQQGGVFRKKVDEALSIGDWTFVLAEPASTRLLAQHVVRGIVLQSIVLGPQDAARQLAGAAFAITAQSGPGAESALQSALYGLSVVAGR